MQFSDPLSDFKPETGPPSGADFRFRLGKPIEEVRQQLLGYSGAVIANDDVRTLILRPVFGSELDPFSDGGKADGVADQVVDGGSHQVRIHARLDRFI